MPSMIPNSAKVKLWNGGVDLDTDTLNVTLHTAAFAPNIDTIDFGDDLTNEVVGAGYTAGGKALANKVVTQDNTNDRAVFDADDLSWPASTITARYAVTRKVRGGAETANEVVFIHDFGADVTSTNGAWNLQWNAAGIAYWG